MASKGGTVMHAFEHPNMSNFLCPICNTRADAPVYLIPIPGTEAGSKMQAQQVHKDCYDVVWNMYQLSNKEDPIA